MAYNEAVSELTWPPINASTRYCAVYGCPVHHSASPAMHNAGFEALGLNWRYLAFEVHPDCLGQALAGAKAMKFVGVNLTLPHKLAALEQVDVLDDSASQLGAINTVCFEAREIGGNWRSLGQSNQQTRELETVRAVGYNTDADALMRSLREDLEFEPKDANVVVVGAGGAGRVAALRLAQEGIARLFLINRTESKVESLATQLQKQFPSLQVALGYPNGEIDLLLNATSLGLKPHDPLPLDPTRVDWRTIRAVYDLIYQPAESPLLSCALAHGCRTANGLGMLLYQGARAFELWTGQPPPVAVMRRELRAHVYGFTQLNTG
jgi:shikimate dehydrogenase